MLRVVYPSEGTEKPELFAGLLILHLKDLETQEVPEHLRKSIARSMGSCLSPVLPVSPFGVNLAM